MIRTWRALRALFARYEAVHLALSLPGFPVADLRGEALAYVDRVRVAGRVLLVEGWSVAPRVTLESAGGEEGTRPRLPRPDVAAARGIAGDVGFALRQPWAGSGGARYAIHIDRAGARPLSQTLTIPRRAVARARARLWLRFLWALVRLCPRLLQVRGRDGVKAAVKDALGLGALVAENRLDAQVFEPAVPARITGGVTIIVPVFNAFDLLQECLARVAQHTDLPWRMVVIEDSSTDTRVRPWLRGWAAQHPQVELIENGSNMGFIGSVNRGLARARGQGDPVVLLNSDALVPAGWASRLIAPLADPGVASVTPMSNDAEICSAPVICARQSLTWGQGDQIDAVARGLRAGPVTLPTGVGFCMALHPRWLARVPNFDPAYGRGYGEEVDWCQRIRAIGGRHVAVGNLFVEHRGGESFGAAKQALVAANNARVAARYPTYDADVQSFITADPLGTPRLALAIAWAGEAAAQAGAPLPVYLAHSLGGGADIDLGRRMARDAARGLPSVVIRVGGAARWQVEVVVGQARTVGISDDLALIQRLLACAPEARIIYSCGVGDRDPAGLPAALLTLAEGRAVEVLVHDYLMVSPSYTLLDADGAYRGPVTAARRDAAHNHPVPIARWQRAWGALLARAETITAFSEDSAALMRAVYPGVAGQIRVAAHTLPEPVGRVTPPRGGGRVIAVLGNIGLQKGAGVVRGLSALPAGDFKLMVLGNIDPDYALPPAIRVHGDYAPRDLSQLVARYGITDWLIPSIWPETFCFTVHEALATGLPTYAFDLGAQGAAVRAARHGVALPLALSRDPAALMAALSGTARDVAA